MTDLPLDTILQGDCIQILADLPEKSVDLIPYRLSMLKNLPSIISPKILKTIAEMGHGDDLVIADGNFPAVSVAQHGHGMPEVLAAISQFLLLDTLS